jgi:hypothetical protein
MDLSAKGIPFMSPLAINRRKIPKQVSMCPMARIYATRIKLGHSRFRIRRLGGKTGQYRRNVVPIETTCLTEKGSQLTRPYSRGQVSTNTVEGFFSTRIRPGNVP